MPRVTKPTRRAVGSEPLWDSREGNSYYYTELVASPLGNPSWAYKTK